MADIYSILVPEIRDDPLGIGYANMSNAEVAEALNAKTRTTTTKRFISLRAIAAVLDDSEYAAVKGAIETIASSNPRVADMLKMLELPCDESGTTGGIDFGNDAVRQMIQALPSVDGSIQQSTIAKLLALGEKSVSRAEELGLTGINEHHVASARQMIL